MATKVLIGTASWQEPDFIEFWYPKGLAKSKLLPYYAEHFGFVEVNGSFYGIPQATTTAQWCKQTPDDFTFNVKLHRLLSRHATEAKFLPPDVRPKAEIINGKVELTAKMEKLIAKKFIAGIEPLLEAKRLGSLLLQLAPSFGPRTNLLTELDNVLALFEGFPIAVELRNRFWLEGATHANDPQDSNSLSPRGTSGERAGERGNRMQETSSPRPSPPSDGREGGKSRREETISFFAQRKITLVSVDTPQSEHVTVMPNIDFMTNPALGYFRLHGRNEEAFVKGRTVQERFDYDYSDEELTEFVTRVTGLADQVQAIHIVLNNNRRRFAPDAALRLMKLIEKDPKFILVRPRKLQGELI